MFLWFTPSNNTYSTIFPSQFSSDDSLCAWFCDETVRNNTVFGTGYFSWSAKAWSTRTASHFRRSTSRTTAVRGDGVEEDCDGGERAGKSSLFLKISSFQFRNSFATSLFFIFVFHPPRFTISCSSARFVSLSTRIVLWLARFSECSAAKLQNVGDSFSLWHLELYL